jgi:hypothetical protein
MGSQVLVLALEEPKLTTTKPDTMCATMIFKILDIEQQRTVAPGKQGQVKKLYHCPQLCALRESPDCSTCEKNQSQAHGLLEVKRLLKLKLLRVHEKQSA